MVQIHIRLNWQNINLYYLIIIILLPLYLQLTKHCNHYRVVTDMTIIRLLLCLTIIKRCLGPPII